MFWSIYCFLVIFFSISKNEIYEICWKKKTTEIKNKNAPLYSNNNNNNKSEVSSFWLILNYSWGFAFSMVKKNARSFRQRFHFELFIAFSATFHKIKQYKSEFTWRLELLLSHTTTHRCKFDKAFSNFSSFIHFSTR